MTDAARLRQTLSAMDLFLVAFGAAIGVGWIIVVGDWLRLAGPAGTVAGFAAGAVILLVVCLCYGEMSAMIPAAGGEVAYCYETYGLTVSFAVGWFLALAFLAVSAFEAISVGWVAATLLPGIEGRTLAVLNGDSLRLGSLALGLGGTWLLVWISYRGVRWAATAQDVATWGLVIAAVAVVAAGLSRGSPDNLTPAFQPNAAGAILPGILAIFISTPNWLSGFAFIPQLMEEKAPGARPTRVVAAMALSVVLAAIFYCAVTVAAAMAAPRQTFEGLSLPVAEVFRLAFGSEVLMRLVLLAGFLGLLTTWNAVILGGSRVLFALGRAHIIHPNFGAVVARTGAPGMAIVFVGVATTLGLFLGRRALLPLLNVVAATQALAFLLVSVGVIVLRRTRPDQPRPFRVPGGVPVAALGALGALLALGLSVVEPYRARGGVPLEWYLFLGWGVLGVFFWFGSGSLRRSLPEAARRAVILGRGSSR